MKKFKLMKNMRKGFRKAQGKIFWLSKYRKPFSSNCQYAIALKAILLKQFCEFYFVAVRDGID